MWLCRVVRCTKIHRQLTPPHFRYYVNNSTTTIVPLSLARKYVGANEPGGKGRLSKGERAIQVNRSATRRHSQNV